MGDAKVLLLVNDQQSQVRKLDRFAKQGMGADDNVDGTLCEFLLDDVEFLVADQARSMRDFDRKTHEPIAKCTVVLAGEQCRWNNDCDLQTGHGSDEGRA